MTVARSGDDALAGLEPTSTTDALLADVTTPLTADVWALSGGWWSPLLQQRSSVAGDFSFDLDPEVTARWRVGATDAWGGGCVSTARG